MLKMTGIELEKISEFDKYLFIEKGIGGGISYITKRYAKANNKCTNDYDPEKPSTFITYLDMKNLHNEWISSLWRFWVVRKYWCIRYKFNQWKKWYRIFWIADLEYPHEFMNYTMVIH